MSATLVNGKGIASAVLANLNIQINALESPLHLAAVCVGEDLGIKTFIRLKERAARSVGVTTSSYMFSEMEKDEVIKTLTYLAVDDDVDGIFIELPLPRGWNVDALAALIPPEKDVDALTKHALVPEPSVLALQYIFREYALEPRGMSAAVIGHGRLVGQPIARWLRDAGARVHIIDADTREPAVIARKTDLVVTGVGKPGLVTGDWIKDGAVVVDFGYTNGRGDVDRESVKQKAQLLTPVPGGMGPLVITAVLENLVGLATR